MLFEILILSVAISLCLARAKAGIIVDAGTRIPEDSEGANQWYWRAGYNDRCIQVRFRGKERRIAFGQGESAEISIDLEAIAAGGAL